MDSNSVMMMSPKKLIRFVMGRKRISYPRVVESKFIHASPCSVGDKGTFVVYTIDKRRFVLPLSYLHNYLFQELFKMSEDEFGLSSSEPIILPCDSIFMNYVISLLQQGMTSIDLEKALLNSIISSSCSTNSTFPDEQKSLQLLLWGY